MEKRVLTQIEKVTGGGTLYGWKRTGTIDPTDTDDPAWMDGGTPGDYLHPIETIGGVPVDTSPSVPELPGSFGSSEVAIDTDDVLWLPAGTVGPTGYERWYMYTSIVGTKSGTSKGRWGVCWTCLEEFPLSELTKIKGHYYCTKNRCKEDFE